jgi:uncharacterized protein
MLVVIDSNVWISAIVFGGTPRKLFETIARNGGLIVASEEIFTEVRRILSQKFNDFTADFEDLKAILQPIIVKVDLGQIRISVCRDEDDNRVLETAVIGGAPVIVTGDKDLLVLSKYKNIDIMTPSQFLIH